MSKILVVCGPTATGKTSLSIDLCRLFNGEIISADSRQVYRGMDIGTGKDIKKGSELEYPHEEFEKEGIGYYKLDGVALWGYDLVSPLDDFSVSHYKDMIQKVIVFLVNKGKLPVLTGGTGLYIKSITEGIDTADIPINNALRKELEEKNVKDLQILLSLEDPDKASSMNTSDIQNPRRLIRAIEVAKWKKVNRIALTDQYNENDLLYIGLTAPLYILKANIEKRVEKRLEEGIVGEIKDLMQIGVGFDSRSMNTLGYREWKDYFNGKADLESVKRSWALNEFKYAKRQLTWFKKHEKIKWFDVNIPGYKEKVEKLVRKWHNESK